MKQFLKPFFLLLYAGLIVIPTVMWFTSSNYEALQTGDVALRQALLLIFPLFGLIAFTMLWAQLMIGAFMPLWNKLYSSPKVLRFHIVHGVVVWLVLLLHPGLLYASKILGDGFTLQALRIDYVARQNVPYVLLGMAAFILLCTTILIALLRKRSFVQKYWKKVHYLNYVVFVMVFVHSFRLGSHVEPTILRYVWFVYGSVFVLALLYKRFYRPVMKASIKKAVSQPTQPPQPSQPL